MSESARKAAYVIARIRELYYVRRWTVEDIANALGLTVDEVLAYL